jgi:hypothetical protein
MQLSESLRWWNSACCVCNSQGILCLYFDHRFWVRTWKSDEEICSVPTRSKNISLVQSLHTDAERQTVSYEHLRIFAWRLKRQNTKSNDQPHVVSKCVELYLTFPYAFMLPKGKIPPFYPYKMAITSLDVCSNQLIQSNLQYKLSFLLTNCNSLVFILIILNTILELWWMFCTRNAVCVVPRLWTGQFGVRVQAEARELCRLSQPPIQSFSWG